MNKIVWFKDCSYENKNLVGGKCSSLGELYHLSKQIGFSVANGFAISTIVYDNFLKFNNIGSIINNKINDIDIDDIRKLETVSKYIKELILSSRFCNEDINLIENNYFILCKMYNQSNLEVAVRSSAIAEDLPDASFAGQQDTYLNIKGIYNLLESIKKCIASLFNTRAIS